MDPILKLEAILAGKAISQHPNQPVVVTMHVPAFKSDVSVTLPTSVSADGFHATVIETEDPTTHEVSRAYPDPQRLYVVVYDADAYDAAQLPADKPVALAATLDAPAPQSKGIIKTITDKVLGTDFKQQ